MPDKHKKADARRKAAAKRKVDASGEERGDESGEEGGDAADEASSKAKAAAKRKTAARRKAAAKAKAAAKPKTTRPVRRTLALGFVSRMAGRRVKQVARKALGLTPRAQKSARKRKREDELPVLTKPKKTRVYKSHMPQFQEPTLGFKIGDSVSAMWYGKQNKGQYFPGHIQSINVKKETMTVLCDDGDVGKNVRWEHVVLV